MARTLGLRAPIAVAGDLNRPKGIRLCTRCGLRIRGVGCRHGRDFLFVTWRLVEERVSGILGLPATGQSEPNAIPLRRGMREPGMWRRSPRWR
ncbi:hypothetical protein GL4_1598 [Methyloceanibacter caenitepidi]|uniref:Uncharacterized protein n=1 Tax=Methyloceanibacter caenitepidi TaxID=1384459 RepID=A0A0A8K265_9HYPH|nr:hypothetical protein GL4_1598 [Methyloceanibacter caenitepidi]